MEFVLPIAPVPWNQQEHCLHDVERMLFQTVPSTSVSFRTFHQFSSNHPTYPHLQGNLQECARISVAVSCSSSMNHSLVYLSLILYLKQQVHPQHDEQMMFFLTYVECLNSSQSVGTNGPLTYEHYHVEESVVWDEGSKIRWKMMPFHLSCSADPIEKLQGHPQSDAQTMIFRGC